MVIIDTPDANGWSHLVATTIKELHEFAKLIGVKRCWFENIRGANQPHYDLKGEQITMAIRHGAIRVSRKDLFSFLKRTYEV